MLWLGCGWRLWLWQVNCEAARGGWQGHAGSSHVGCLQVDRSEMELDFRAGHPLPVPGQGGPKCARRLCFWWGNKRNNFKECNRHGQWGLVALGQGQIPRYCHGQHRHGAPSQGVEENTYVAGKLELFCYQARFYQPILSSAAKAYEVAPKLGGGVWVAHPAASLVQWHGLWEW